MISKPINEHDWRASLVPAAAVIPAPIAYTNAVAVKKLVVGFRFGSCREALCFAQCQRFFRLVLWRRIVDSTLCVRLSAFRHGIDYSVEASFIGGGNASAQNMRIRVARGCYCEQNSVSKAADCSVECLSME